MKMRQAHLDTKMKMRQAHLDHENEDALLVALLCVALPRRIMSRHCIVASRCRVASRLVVDPLVIALLCVALPHLVVASRCCIAALRVSSSSRLVVASHLRLSLMCYSAPCRRIASLPRCISSLHCQFHCRVASHRRIMASSIFLSKLLNAL
jgi:hypothetical protein